MYQVKANSFNEIYPILLHAILDTEHFKVSPRDKPTIEVLNWSFELTDPHLNTTSSEVRNVDYNYANALKEYTLHGGQNIEEILKYRSEAEKFIYDENFPGKGVNYGVRISEQLQRMIQLLRYDTDTRRAVIHILKQEDGFIPRSSTSLEYPCCESLQFFIRDFQLHLIVTMRSQNAYMILPYDVYNFTSLQIMIAERLGLEVGTYYHNMKSLHIYQNELEFVQTLINQHTL